MDINYPDYITSSGGSDIAMYYDGSKDAGISYDGAFQVVHFGFPFESINSASVRSDVMDAVLDFFGLVTQPTPTPTSTATPTPTSTSTPTPTPTSTPDPEVVDNDDGAPGYTETGSWSTSGSTGYNGGTYRYATVGGAHTATWEANQIAGNYDVEVIYRAGTNRASSTKYVIHASGGDQTVYIDQTQNDLVWVDLGNFAFDAGSQSITLDAAGSSGNSVVISDAVRFTYTSGGSPTPTPTPTPTPSGTAAPFGDYVQEVIDELEYRKATDTSGYLMKDLWGKYTGVTETLTYQDTSYMWNECAPGEPVEIGGSTYYPYGKSYCSGLTLEIFHRAMKKRDIDLGIAEEDEDWNGLGTLGIFIIKKIWNVIIIHYSDTGELVTSKPSPPTALEMSGLGYTITYGEESKFEDVQMYDFCDISRSTGTGHSVVFINWVRDGSNNIIGLQYYSSQGSTNGQGYNTEYFYGSGGTVLKSYFHAGRVYDDPADNTTNTIREAGYY